MVEWMNRRGILIAVFVIFLLGMQTGFSQTRSDFLIAENIITPPGMAQDSTGQIHMVWGIAPDTTNAWYLVYSRFDSLLNPLGAPVFLPNTAGCAEPDVQTQDSVVVLTYREIRLSRFTDFIWAELWDLNGHRRYDPLMLNSEYHDANRFSPHAVFINDTTFQTAWSGQGPWPYPYAGYSGVFGRSCTTHGVLGDSILLVCDLPIYFQQDLFGSQLVHFPHDSTFLAVWWDKRSGKPAYYGRLFTNAGTPLGASFPVSEDTSTLNLYYYDVANGPDDSAVIVWSAMAPDSTWHIQWRWLNGQGAFLSPTEQVNPENVSVRSQSSIAVAIDKFGRAIVCWEADSSGGSQIYAQRFSADHQRIGNAFKVSEHPAADHFYEYYPVVWFHRSNLVYVTWSEWSMSTPENLWGKVFEFEHPPVGIQHETPLTPTQWALAPAYPNPFNSTTQIQYSLQHPTNVQLSVYNLKGQLITNLVNTHQPAGHYHTAWAGQNAQGISVATGVYYVVLQTPSAHLVRKVVLLK